MPRASLSQDSDWESESDSDHAESDSEPTAGQPLSHWPRRPPSPSRPGAAAQTAATGRKGSRGPDGLPVSHRRQSSRRVDSDRPAAESDPSYQPLRPGPARGGRLPSGAGAAAPQAQAMNGSHGAGRVDRPAARNLNGRSARASGPDSDGLPVARAPPGRQVPAAPHARARNGSRGAGPGRFDRPASRNLNGRSARASGPDSDGLPVARAPQGRQVPRPAVRYVLVCPRCTRQFSSTIELRRHRNHRHARQQCSPGLKLGMPRPVRSGASTGGQELSDSDMDTDVVERLMSIGGNYELTDDGPGNVVPPGSEVSDQTDEFAHGLHTVCTEFAWFAHSMLSVCTVCMVCA